MPFDRSKYPDNWEEISNYIRFERAVGRCECSGQCGTHTEPCTAVHGKPHPITGSVVVLTTMHLDHDTTHNDDDNLLAACQKCHLAYDAEYHAFNAAVTRYEQKIAAGQMVLIDGRPEWTAKE
jgi:hypothetical protein